MIATMTQLFGDVPFWGRIISSLFGILAGIYLFLLVKNKAGEGPALFSVIFFIPAPYPFYFFRTVMSDPGMIFFIIAAVYHFDLYCENEKSKDALIAAAFTSLAGLFKPFALHIGLAFLIMAVIKFRWTIFRRPVLYLFAIIALAPPVLWVMWAAKTGTLGGVTDGRSVVAAPHLWGKLSLLWDPSWYFKLQGRLFDRMSTPVVSILALGAIFTKEGRKKGKLFFIWLLSVAFYMAVVRSGNQGHNYYQLPASPAFGALGAIGFMVILKKTGEKFRMPLFALIVLGFFIVSFIYTIPHFSKDLSSHIAGEMAAKHTNPGDKILVMDPGVTRKNQVIFSSGREGWHFNYLKIDHLWEYKELGAKVVVLVIEQSQMEKAEEMMKHLAGNYLLLEKSSGEFNHRSAKAKNRRHNILIYKL